MSTRTTSSAPLNEIARSGAYSRSATPRMSRGSRFAYSAASAGMVCASSAMMVSGGSAVASMYRPQKPVATEIAPRGAIGGSGLRDRQIPLRHVAHEEVRCLFRCAGGLHALHALGDRLPRQQHPVALEDAADHVVVRVDRR